MSETDKRPGGPNRIREALGQIYNQYPPYFREYLRKYQEDPTSRVFAPLAEAYRRLGRADEAIDICKEGLSHHPDFHGGRVALAKCLIDRRRFDEARAELERVTQSVPDNLLAQKLLGETLTELGQKEGALHALKMALLLAPQDVSLAERVRALESGRSAVTAGAQPSSHSGNKTVRPEAGGSKPSPEALVQEFKGEDLELDSADDLAPLWGDAATVNLPVLSSVDKVEAVQDAADRLWMPENNVVEGAATASSLVDDLFSSNLFSEGESEVDDEAFKVETLKSLFENQKTEGSKEITTETLADLYLSQGQYDKALRMLDRIYQQKPNVELLKKLNKCRERLGVGRKQLIQQRQIEFLKNLLQVAQRQKRALSKLDS